MQNITIIGAGLGGLTAGALLAKKGHKVTLLEQHTIVGGCATTFKRKGGFTCEVGLHEMDAVFEDRFKKEIFETLGVYDTIEFIQPNEFFKVVAKDIEFVMPHHKKDAIEALIVQFPEEQDAIAEYFRLIEKISNEFFKLANASWWHYLLFPFIFRNLLRYRTNSTWDIMNRLFKNESLKLILNANVGYYSDKIQKLSFLYHAIGQQGYFSGGGWFIHGGSQTLSDYLASVIVKHGGEVIVKAEVRKIEENKVTYRVKNEMLALQSDIIISNLSPYDTYQLANISYQDNKAIASSLLSIYIGFKDNLKSIYGKSAYSTFYLNSIKNIEEYDQMIDNSVEDRSFIFVDYSQIDSGLTPQDKSFAVITLTDYLEDWEHLSKEAYKVKKQRVLESYLSKLEESYPNLKEHIAFAEVGTAKTMQHYLKTPKGTAYGFAPTPKDFFRVPQVKSKKMKNLYFVGAWVIGGGFTPAILSGGLCAEEILK